MTAALVLQLQIDSEELQQQQWGDPDCVHKSMFLREVGHCLPGCSLWAAVLQMPFS